MGNLLKAIPKPLHAPMTAGIRSAMSLALVAGLGPTARIARGMARTYAGLRANRRRLDRTAEHIRFAFPERTPDEATDLAVRVWEHLFLLGVEFAYAPRLLNEPGWMNHLGLANLHQALRELVPARPVVLLTGHCGNWEVMGFVTALLGFPMHALYRPLDLSPLDRWVRDLRERRGLVLVDKFGALRQLPDLVAAGAPMGFVADQNAGDRGMFVPFFGRLASTYKSIGLLAMEFDCTLVCAFARRTGPGTPGSPGMECRLRARRPGDSMGYTVEVTDIIRPEDWKAQPDPLFYLTARYRRAIELMVRSAPDQYLWMHRVWKSRPRHERLGREFPRALREKIAALPWMTGGDVDRLVEQSALDAAELARSGRDRLD